MDFFTFTDPTFRLVAIGTVFLSVSAATVGCFAFLRKRALVGDAIAHAILPGLALAFLLSQSKNPLYLLLGALASGWLAMYLIEFLAQRSKLSGDTSIALVLSVFFGFGILLLTHIQHSSSASQAGLDEFLFGQAAGMRKEDLQVYAGVALLLLLIIALLYKELMLFSFNPEFAATAGLPTQRLKYVLNAITVLAIAIGIQSVGVVLMAALLITPAAAARAWTDRLGLMILLSAFLGAFSGLVGSYISYSAPNMPTGPWIVMSLSVLALLSLFLAPRRGLLARLRQQRRNRHKIADENLLKVFFQAGEKQGRLQVILNRQEIMQHRQFRPGDLQKTLRRLLRKDFLLPQGQAFKLSRQGLDEARRIVRLHRLWEMYLSQRLRLKADHIHPNAETIEHLITPEIEEQLLQELDFPTLDPHQSPIPYTQ